MVYDMLLGRFILLCGALFLLGFGTLIDEFSFRQYYIPSGSMVPTLLVGDHVIAMGFIPNKLDDSWRWTAPEAYARLVEKRVDRGDLAIFKLPTNIATNWVKRIIGLPGDQIQMVHGQLYLNGRIVARHVIQYYKLDYGNGIRFIVRQYVETLPRRTASGPVEYRIVKLGDNGPLDNTPVYRVPAGHYFALGDNRDNSEDSRVMSVVGFIPAKNFVGLIKFITYSRRDNSVIPHLRWGRFFVDPDSYPGGE